jgi:hypothetical protein
MNLWKRAIKSASLYHIPSIFNSQSINRKSSFRRAAKRAKINSLNVVFCMLYSNGLYVTFFFGFVRCTVYDLKINFYNIQVIPEEKFITNILKWFNISVTVYIT